MQRLPAVQSAAAAAQHHHCLLRSLSVVLQVACTTSLGSAPQVTYILAYIACFLEVALRYGLATVLPGGPSISCQKNKK